MGVVNSGVSLMDDARTRARWTRGVRLWSGGLQIGGELLPLLAGSVHYWRLDPRDWRACLQSVKDLGLRLVDTYVPWAVHETAPGMFELGQRDPQRDVAAFMRLAHEMGLFVIARPGPHINAEMTCFGIPERLIWDPSCQARSPEGHPVMLPMLPSGFPVPSYASEAFHDEVARYFHALGPSLAPLLYPTGPIVMLQVDNEGAMYFRDGAYDQDYHPDAIALYRAFLRDKYRTIDALTRAYGKRSSKPPMDEGERFASITPPTSFDAEHPEDLPRHLDWCEFHEHLLETAMGRFARALAEAGLDGVPTTHNLPMGQETTALNAARLTRVVDLCGLDYYNTAAPVSRAIIARRTTELSVRCEGLGIPAFACEMGAGFPPFFPPLEERDSAFTVLTAMAYGLRGYNVYMAVERDRWIGAPIDRRGRKRPFAAFWRKLSAAMEATSFHTLKRRTPVRILVPRSERRLTRAMHAFGPLIGAFFSVLGAGARERCLEDDLGLGYPLAVEADTFARAFEEALDVRGVPYAYVGGEDREVSLGGAQWLICATSGALQPSLLQRLEEAAQRGALVTLGPREPVFDGAFRALPEPYDLSRLRAPRAAAHDPQLLQADPAAANAAVARAIEALGLPTYACDPEGVFATVHEDDAGQPRVLFLINPGDMDVIARVAIDADRATDLLEDGRYEVRRGSGGSGKPTTMGRASAGLLEIRLMPRTVRMLALDR
ncbi:beta-galactosidase [Chondromyces apiculatus]|uniref:Beta-galactosidase n=1 Tax=Chondromyces apiculatus DSM 436 TaxID=1192034 RepID=A0A017SVC2_9BACT|nr:beta-galactosidase [Chondromyces apiculatus]EYF00938.1 beta-galactosidase [Chondromyces apiculatus DSM 436]